MTGVRAILHSTVDDLIRSLKVPYDGVYTNTPLDVYSVMLFGPWSAHLGWINEEWIFEIYRVDGSMNRISDRVFTELSDPFMFDKLERAILVEMSPY